MRRVIKTGLASIAVGVMGATLLGTAPAQAATTTATGGGAHRVVTQAMTVTGFNVKVAAAHGYEIRTTPSGVQYSVKKGTPSTATPSIAHPNTTIGGNCGSSYIDYNAVGNLSVKVQTGFNVDEPATSYWWLVVMKDNGGQSSHTWSGGLLLRTSWGVTRTFGGMTAGESDAYVSTGSSAILVDGSVCTSGGLEDFTWIY